MFSKKLFLAAALGFLAIGVTDSYAIVMHQGADSADYEAYADQFSSVGYFLAWEGDRAVFSSIVALDSRWAITSAHGALQNENDPSSFGDRYSFGTGTNALSDPGELIQATDVFLYPGYIPGFNGYDVALIYFGDEPLTGVDYASLYQGTPQVGDYISIVGYGCPGYGDSGWLDADYQKRACKGYITGFGSSGGLFGEPIPEWFAMSEFDEGLDYYDPLGGLIASGDSGGGWFIDGELAVITKGYVGTGYWGDSVGTVLDSDIQLWISDTMASVPEPSAFVLLFLAALAVLPLRRNCRNRS